MKSNCPPKIVLEGYFFDGKLPEDVEDHIQSCTDCRGRIQLLSEQKETFLKKYPFERFWETRREKGFWKKLEIFLPPRPVLALATLAGLMVFALWSNRQSPEILSKGGFGLEFYVSHEGKIERGKSGMPASEGDDLQFVYSAEREGSLLLFGVEADRTLTVYFPDGGSMSGAVEAGKKKRLPQALRWKPTTPYERFFALFSEKPISVAEVQAALQKSFQEGKSIEETSRFPLAYPQSSIILYRRDGK